MKFLIPILFLATASCPIKPMPNPTPEPTPIPTPTPTPVPTPTPIQSCSFPQGVPEDQFKQVTNPLTLASRVDSVIAEHTSCAIGSDCILGNSDPQFYLSSIINWLIEDGLCAGQHVDGQTDELSVALNCDANTIWESYHSVNFGNTTRRVAWNPGSARPAWTVPVSCDLKQKPTPPPFNPSCGEAPRPPCGSVSCPTSVDRILVGIRDQAAWIVDATPQTCNKDWCNANGFAGRNCCPLGSEGSDQRPICESRFAPYNWFLNNVSCPNSTCWLNGDPPNPLQLRVPKGNTGTVSVCSGSICGSGTIQ